MPESKVSFVLMQDERPLTTLTRLDPDRDWREFVTTTSAWILQTYLRLKAAGHDVELRNSLPESGIAVISCGDYDQVLRQRWRSTGALLAVTRGSLRRTPPFADAVIVQNPVEADGERQFFMAHWSQPGLVPRDASRGSRIENAAFKGFPGNLDPAFDGQEWLEFLRDQHICWVRDAVKYADQQTDTRQLQFPDYRNIDLIVAVRPANPEMYPGRPASKLVNAWLAGVPAILGPEHAYRALRKSPLDYIEVTNLVEAKEAVLKLIRQPELYRAMVENGLARGAEFTPDRVVRLWEELLFERLPRLASDPAVKFRLGRPIWQRQLIGRWRWRQRTVGFGPRA